MDEKLKKRSHRLVGDVRSGGSNRAISVGENRRSAIEVAGGITQPHVLHVGGGPPTAILFISLFVVSLGCEKPPEIRQFKIAKSRSDLGDIGEDVTATNQTVEKSKQG